MRPVGSCASTQSVDAALDMLLDQRLQILIVKDEFGGTTGLLSMEDVIETLLGVEIIDEADQEAIKEGTGAEDLREFAKEKFGLDNGEES
jgi:CBS domain containing-hemolysin-like protein